MTVVLVLSATDNTAKFCQKKTFCYIKSKHKSKLSILKLDICYNKKFKTNEKQ